MHAVIENLLSRKRQNRQEKASQGWEAYREILAELVAGKEVDVDELEIVLDQVGRTEEQLERDIETFSQRQRYAADMAAHKQAMLDIVDARKAHEKARADLEAAIAKYQPAVDSTHEIVRALERRIDATTSAEMRLRETVMDETIAERKQRLTDKRRDLVAEIRQAEAVAHDWEATASREGQHVSKWQRAFDWKQHSYSKGQADEHRRRVATAQQNAEQQRVRAVGLQQQVDQLNAELAELEKLELTP